MSRPIFGPIPGPDTPQPRIERSATPHSIKSQVPKDMDGGRGLAQGPYPFKDNMRIEIEPLLCFAIVRKSKFPNTSIILMEDTVAAMNTFHVISCPSRYIDASGTWCDSVIKVGDEVMLQPDNPWVHHPLQWGDEMIISMLGILGRVHRHPDEDFFMRDGEKVEVMKNPEPRIAAPPGR